MASIFSSTLTPLAWRITDAEANLAAAELVWRNRARELDARPSALALDLARDAAIGVREACDDLEALRAEARA